MEVNNMKENYVKPQIEVCQLNTENQLMTISGIPAKKEEPDHEIEILSLENYGKYNIWSRDEDE